MPKNDTILTEATRRLAEQFHPAAIHLSGSRAASREGGDDLDIIVVCSVDPSQGRRALAVAMDRALRGLDLPRRITILTPDEFEADRNSPGTIARLAAREGEIVYDAAA